MIKWKDGVNVLALLKEHGVNSTICRTTGLISQGVMTSLKKNPEKVPGINVLSTICSILKCQPGDLIEWVPDDTDDMPE